MIKTVAIVPAILTGDKQFYDAQVASISTFARRVQIDITDGVTVPTKTLDLASIYWPENWIVDLHLIVARPSEYLDTILRLKPSLCIFHAEATEDLLPLFAKLKENGIKSGVALLEPTFPGYVKPYIDAADHVLIFAGQLGTQGSAADMMQVEKIPLVRAMKPTLEIGWDGGANLSNIRALAHTELDVINVGSALSAVPNPAEVYAQMVKETDENGVVL